MRNFLFGGVALGVFALGVTAHAQVPIGPCYQGSSCNLGTGSLTANGGINTTGAMNVGAINAPTMTLSGAGTALTVTNNAEFGAGGSAPITLSSGTVTLGGTTNVSMANGGPVVIYAGSYGAAYVLNSAGSTVTGRLNLSPGTSNNPILFSANNSSNTEQSIAFTQNNSGQQLILSVSGLTGTYVPPLSSSYNDGGNPGAFLIAPQQDTVALGYTYGGVAMSAFNVVKYAGGTGTTGSREAGSFLLNQNAATSDTQNVFYQTLNVAAQSEASMGGSSGTPLGSIVPLGMYSIANSGATNLLNVGGEEIDMAIHTGASAQNLTGYALILYTGNAVAPSGDSVGYYVGASTGVTPTLHDAFTVGTSTSHNPLSSSGGILRFILATGDTEPTLGYGINISGPTYTGNTWNDGHVTISGAGAITMPLTAGTAATYACFTSGGTLISSATAC